MLHQSSASRSFSLFPPSLCGTIADALTRLIYSKMESFIRSKYESKRWAMQGPPPPPETLDSDGEAEAVSRYPDLSLSPTS